MKSLSERAPAYHFSLSVHHCTSIRSSSHMDFFHFLPLSLPLSILGLCIYIIFYLFAPNSLLIFLRCQLHCHLEHPHLFHSLFLLFASLCGTGWLAISPHCDALPALLILLLTIFSHLEFLSPRYMDGTCVSTCSNHYLR